MISVTILTRDSQKYLPDVLHSLAAFDEVLVYDNGSTDSTLDIAKQFSNVHIHQGPFLGFGKTHNMASSLAKHEWILSIDSDEIATPEFVQEVRAIALDPQCVYAFPRENIFNKRVIYGCGWYPDRQLRLYHKKMTCFSDAQVHEQILTEGMRVVPMNSPIRHYSYETIGDFLTKMQLYSDLFARQNAGKRKASAFTALWHGAFAFFKSYILKKGFLGGYEGFVISSYNAQTAFYKYLKLRELNSQSKEPVQKL